VEHGHASSCSGRSSYSSALLSAFRAADFPQNHPRQISPELARPAPRHHIDRTTEDASTRTSICSYAKIATLAQQDLSSLDDMWDPQDACSQAILPGKLKGDCTLCS